MVIDMTIPGDTKVCDKERDKVEKYIESLGIEIRIDHAHKSIMLGMVRKVLTC